MGGFQGLLPGSVSKYCLQHSPVPVIVVRPTSKRDKARDKRANDPDRQTYRKILEKSESLIDVDSPRNSFFANDDEATALASAIAKKQPPQESVHPLAQVARAADIDDDETLHDNMLAEDPRSPAQLMKSPHLQNLESPDFSDDPSSGEEDEDGGVPMSPPPDAGARASEIARGRGGTEIFDDEDISPMAQAANPLDATRTNTEGHPSIEVMVTDPNDPSRVDNKEKTTEGT